MKHTRRQHPRKIIHLLSLPLLLLVFMQAAISFGAVILGGTFTSLRTYAADRLEQVTETRQIIFEGKIEQWSEMNEEYLIANSTLDEFLTENGIGLNEFLSDDGYHERFLSDLLPTWVYLMRTNSTTGAFLILANRGTEGGNFSALYLRDGDPGTNSVDYSDVRLAVGPASVSQTHRIPLDIEWSSRLPLAPNGEKEADEFFYAPFVSASAHPESDAVNHRYWSRPFRLADNPEYSYRMITCSIPLITSDGEVWGVMGVEISLTHLEENLPYREIDSDHRGGYLLLESVGEGKYHVVYASGPNAGQFTMNEEELVPESAGIDGLLSVERNGKTHYLAMKPLRLYNTNTPFYGRGWYLVGLEDHNTLFGFGDSLLQIFIIATVISLLVALALAIVLVHFVTKPIRRLSACIQNAPENRLGEFPQSYIVEVNELYGTIKALTDRQKQIEYDLSEEKERYHVALQSSSDILFSHDLGSDCTIFHNLHGGESELTVTGIFSGERSGYLHPDDIGTVSARLKEGKERVSFSFRVDLSGKGEQYRWYEFNGRILSTQEGQPKTLIGAMHDIQDRKMRELAAAEALKKDPLTGLYRRSSGEALIREGIRAGKRGCLLLFDVIGFGELNRRVGLVAGNLVLEEVGDLLQRRAERETARRFLPVRMGGDEFLLWLEDCNEREGRAVAKELSERAERIYEGDGFKLRLGCACVCMKEGEGYESLLARACSELLSVVGYGPRAQDASGEDPLGKAISEIENIPTYQSIVPLTFAMFDKGGEIGTVLSVLFPKLHRALGARDIVLSRISRDFFTVSTAYQWHEGGESVRDSQVVHYAAGEFSALQNEIWPDSDARNVSELTAEQRRFLRVPKGKSGLAFPLFDNGAYIGALVFTRAPGEELWDEAQRNELYELVKIIESNLNRQRYDAASRAKSDFLSRMSHEIRTPMNAIIGMTYIAKTHLGDGDALSADLNKIDQSSHYLLGLINDILDMSQIESGKLTIEQAPFDLSLLLGDVSDLIAPQAESKEVRFSLEKELVGSWVTGDLLHLKQVLINLLGNAVKFTPSGGSILLSVRQNADGTVRFSVKDTGIGVSPESKERIFRAFEQAETSTARHYGGTGLGLSISSRLVQMMGGSIQLDSTPGRGSDFYFTILLPFCDSPDSVEAPEEDIKRRESIEGVRILLVEDNELNIEIAQSILEMNGAIVTLAHNGQEAVEIFTSSKEGEFELILMDIQMPVMDGLEATKRIRRSDHPAASSVPIIAMTANAFDEDMKRSVESGMNGHLSKPLDFDKLLAVIGEVLGKDRDL